MSQSGAIDAGRSSRRAVRGIALAVLTLATVGLLGGALGYAGWLRSGSYRAGCVTHLSRALDLPCDIGRVVPLSFRSREFRDVVVWLPDRRAKAHSVRRAVVTHTPTRDDPDAYEIDLLGGASEVSPRTWLRGDVRGVIESGLRGGLSGDGPRRVVFRDMNLVFDRDEFRLRLSRAAGTVLFGADHVGRASVTCSLVNDHALDSPLVLLADFSSPGGGVRLDCVELKVPDAPLAIADLRDLIGADVRSGRFHGTLEYRETADERSLAVTGHCFDLDLEECTSGVAPAAWRGRCPEIELLELRLVNREPQRVRFRGMLADVALGDVLRTLGLPGIDATVGLTVGDAVVTREGVQRLVATGRCTALPLRAVSEALGYGAISGALHITIDDLTIVDNRLRSLLATLRVEPADDGSNWIETRLLREVASRLWNVPLPPLPLERVAYSELGVQLEVIDERLTVFGTHGERGQTILTARVVGRDVPILNEPRGSFDISPLLETIREQIAERIRAVENRIRPAGG